MWDTGVAYGAIRKKVRQWDLSGLENQIPHKQVTRQVAVKIQNLGAAGGDSPKDGGEQNVFDAWKKKTYQFHEDIIIV